MNSTSPISHESISRRAYQIWEEAGRPDAHHTSHWLQAERDLRALNAKINDGESARGKSVKPIAASDPVQEKAPHSTNYVHPGVTTDSLHHKRR